MSLIISLETSGSVCSVSIHNSGKILATKEIHEKNAHASLLSPLIDELMRETGTQPSKLNAVAVSSGPGSYTGLRIGTSTAKGLCYALQIPLIAVGSLDILAASVRPKFSNSWLCPMIDARRMEVYCTLLDSNDHVVQEVEAKVINEQSYSEYLNNEKIIFFGDGSAKCKDLISHPNANFVDNIFPSSLQLGEIAHKKFQDNQFEDLVNFEPFYLKEFLIKKSTKSLI